MIIRYNITKFAIIAYYIGNYHRRKPLHRVLRGFRSRSRRLIAASLTKRLLSLCRITKMPQRNPLETPELLEHILSFLELADLARADRVSRFWRVCTVSPRIEQRRFRRPVFASAGAHMDLKFHPFFELQRANIFDRPEAAICSDGTKDNASEASVGSQLCSEQNHAAQLPILAPSHCDSAIPASTFGFAPITDVLTLPALNLLAIELSNDSKLELVEKYKPSDETCCLECEDAMDCVIDAVDSCVVLKREAGVRVGELLSEVSIQCVFAVWIPNRRLNFLDQVQRILEAVAKAADGCCAKGRGSRTAGAWRIKLVGESCGCGVNKCIVGLELC